MQPSQTPFVKRWHRRLAAIIAAASVLLFAITTTHAESTQRQHLAAPAGPQGPIELTCRAGRASVISHDGPAGPQGPVVTDCGTAAQR